MASVRHVPGWWATLVLLCAAAAAASSCPVTKTYVASPVEAYWVDHIAELQSQAVEWPKGCAVVRAQRHHIDDWIRFNRAVETRPGRILEGLGAPPAGNLSEVYSYQVLTPNSSTAGCPTAVRYVPIEPLAAALRHPRWPCLDNIEANPNSIANPIGKTRRSQSKALRLSRPTQWNTEYLLFVPVGPATHAYAPGRRAYFYDLGSTYYGPTDAGACTDCLSQFIRKYKVISGVEFDEIYCWEVKQLPPALYWKRVPKKMAAKIHFYNTATSPDLGNPMSALRMILQVAHPDDFVVFKLDIDNNEVEVRIVLTILDSPALIARIDELYWEHHVKGSPTQWGGWQDLGKQRGSHSDMPSSYTLFRRLREAGIRAHSWV